VLAPVEVVGSAAGVSVAVLFVELWPERVRVVLAAVPGAETERRDADYRAGLQAWAHRRRAGEEGEPPVEPGIFTLLDPRTAVEITDDVGTGYRWDAAGGGGSGWGWHGEVSLRPAPPAQARRLTITACAPGGALGRIEVDLAPDLGVGFADPNQGPLSRVLSPGVVLGEVEGVPVVLAGVELWPGRTIVTLLAPKTPGAWGAEPSPALHLTDDRGTVYRWSGGTREDPADGWRRELPSARAVPMGVRELTFRLPDSNPYRLALPPA
jgi:hypothetical protein